MHYGLAHLESSFHQYNLHKVVQMAPCFYVHDPNWTKAYMNSTIMQFQSLGIYAINGPNWDRDLKTICDNFPGPICSYYTNRSSAQGLSVKDEQHWATNGSVDRFQEFADHWLDGVHKTDLVDVSKISKVPMAFFVGTNDQVCQHKVALNYISQMNTQTTVIDVKGEGHLYFCERAYDDWFMQQLIAQLQVPKLDEVEDDLFLQ